MERNPGYLGSSLSSFPFDLEDRNQLRIRVKDRPSSLRRPNLEPGVSYFGNTTTFRSALRKIYEPKKYPGRREEKEYRGMESRNGARLNELSLSISDRFRRRGDVTYEALRMNGRKEEGKKGARGPGLICRNKLHRKKCKIECRRPCSSSARATRWTRPGVWWTLRVSSGQDENVGSFNVTRGGWQRERERVRQGGGRGPGVVIYEVSKTLYTPTRQRAGLAPRNPVLALTHRYLSHDHFRPIRARAALHTGIHEAKPRLSPRS